MRRLLVAVLCCCSGFQITLSHCESSNLLSGYQPHLYEHSRKTLSLPSPKPIQLRGVIGKLPKKGAKLSKLDEVASYKAGSAFKQVLYTAFPDTYTIEHYGPIDINLPGSWIRGKLYLNNLVVKGIHQIVLRQLEVRTKKKRIDFTAFAPAISINMNFEVEGNIGYTPAYLSGQISLNKQSLSPSGAVSVKKVNFHPYHGERYQLDAGDVTTKIENINITLQDSDVDADLNFLKEQVIEETKDKLAQLIMGTIFKEVNKMLEEIPAADIYKFLTKND